MIDDFIHSSFAPNAKVKKNLKPLQTKLDTLKVPPAHEPTSAKSAKSPLSTRIKEKVREFMGHFDQAPAFLQDNKYILTGYRIGFHTPAKVLKTLFMIHNESMNIWTHLGGAIGLIILCIFLAFSMSTTGLQNIQQFEQYDEIDGKNLFKPIFEKLPNFAEFDISERLSQTRDGITSFGQSAVTNLEYELASLVNEVEYVKKNINPEAVGKLFTLLQEQLENFSQTCSDVKDSVTMNMDRKKLEDMTQSLKRKLTQLQKRLVAKIDSSDFDWIDIYKYINPNKSAPATLDEQYEAESFSRWPIIVFLISAVFCLLCSAVFHLFYCQSYRANQIFLRLDYAGISILVTGSCFPAFVYGFYCQPFYYTLYLSLIAVTSLVVFFVSLFDFIHSEPYRKMKDLMYGGLGLFAGLPMLHLIYLNATNTGSSDVLDFVPSLPYYLALGVSYLVGLIIYSFKLPERFNPGKFDIFGHSHQIWHCCVLLGVIFTYLGAFDNYYTRMQTPCLCEL